MSLHTKNNIIDIIRKNGEEVNFLQIYNASTSSRVMTFYKSKKNLMEIIAEVIKESKKELNIPTQMKPWLKKYFKG